MQINQRKMAPFLPLWLWLHQHGVLLALSLALLLPLLVLIKRARETSITGHRRRRLPPSPPRLPVIGNLHQVGSISHRSLAELSRQHGPLMLLQLGQAPTLVVSSAAMAEEVMKTQDSIFANRPQLEFPRQIFYGCKGTGFLPYGEHWRNLRKLYSLHLLGTKSVQSYKVAREEEVAFMMEKIVGQLSSSSSAGGVNLREILQDFVYDLVSKVIHGRPFRDQGLSRVFRELMQEQIALFLGFHMGDYYPSLRWVSVLAGVDSKVRRTSQKWDRVLDSIIGDRLHVSECNEGGIHQEITFVDALLALQKDPGAEFSLTTETIRALIIEILQGGTDSSHVTLEWAMAELILSPEAMKRAQAEVRRVAGAKPSIEEADIAPMSYLKAVIKETLRLHPPGTLLLPRLSSEDTHVGGYYIPKHTRVLINAWAIMRDPGFWDAPEDFCPERFLGASSVDFRGRDFHFIPFGAGRRICPGLQFAVSAVELVLANLLHRFDWEMPDGMRREHLDMEEKFALNTSRKHSLRLVPIPHVHSTV